MLAILAKNSKLPKLPESCFEPAGKGGWPPISTWIKVDIGGHPPFPAGSKQISGNFGNLLFLAGFNFRGHFEGLNEGFLRLRLSLIAKGMIYPPK
jgi:hypothetical protein